MEPSGNRSKDDGGRRDSPWTALRWPATVFLLALLVFLAYRETLDRAGDGARALGDAAGNVADRAQAIAEGFFSGDVTERFVSSMPVARDAGGGRLEVATLEMTESLSRSEERRMAWDILPLGTTTVEIEVPVTYRYHLELDDRWKIEVHGPVCLVLAPPIRPSLPPAIDTGKMRTTTDQGHLRFDGAEKLAELQRSLTPRLSERADSPRNRDLVREPARRTVEAFVRGWLLEQAFWTDNRFATVRVVFADESEAEALFEGAGGTGRPTVVEEDPG